LKGLGGLWRHTVDAPVCLPVAVADGDREPAEVGPDDADEAVEARPVAVLAGDGHVFALASVVSLVEGAVWSATC
jgi:hypothetical protein